MESPTASKPNQPTSTRNTTDDGVKQPQSSTAPGEGAHEKDENQPKSLVTPPISTSADMESDETAMKNQKLVEEFQYLLEKSQSLFAGLR
jgi:hypothetical protein